VQRTHKIYAIKIANILSELIFISLENSQLFTQIMERKHGLSVTVTN